MLKPHHHIFYVLLVIHLRSSLSTTPPTEISALKAFKSAINPSTIPPSSCLDSWDFSTDPCSSPKTTHFICGLTCDPTSSRVISLTLDSVGYSGTLTPLISHLTHLLILDLGQNSFHGPIPPSLPPLLQSLSFRYNSFSGPLPNTLSSLSSLQDLDLSGNFLSGPLPNTLSFLSHLTRLDLSFNHFSGTLPRLPPNLLTLAIKSNSLSGPIQQSSFTGLTHLETIELSANSFSGVLPSWFFLLPSLQQINLSNNSFTRVDIPHPTPQRSSVIAVDLSFNKIAGGLPVNFAEFPNLASLSLRYNRFSGPIPWQYSNMITMRRLYLDGNYLSGTPPKGFFYGGGKESSTVVDGSFGDNCLRGCPPKSQLCLPSQKPMSVCKQAYGGKKPRNNK